jgi:hypothetical protein
MTYDEAINSTGPITEEVREAVAEEFRRTCRDILEEDMTSPNRPTPKELAEWVKEAERISEAFGLVCPDHSVLVSAHQVMGTDGQPMQSRFVETPDGTRVQVKVGDEWKPEMPEKGKP